MNKKETIKCSSCGEEKDAARHFYTSYSPFNKASGRSHVCKKCLTEYVGIDKDIKKFLSMLRMVDKPFISHLYEAVEQRELNIDSHVGEYFKLINAKDFRHLTWEDSDFEGHKKSKLIENELLEDENHPQDINGMRKRWGVFEDSDYEYLENFYFEYSNHYATETPVQINLYRNIAKVHLQAEKELSNGNTKAFKDLMELSSKLHNDGNIKPIQSTGANDDKGLSTYGLWIKTIEFEEPCEHFDNKPIYEDYDKFKKYIDKWFVRPFKNIFNISKDFDIKED